MGRISGSRRIRRGLRRIAGVDAIGHRIVHGGVRFTSAALIDDAVVDSIASLTSLAPLHQPRALAAIEAVCAVRPGVPGRRLFRHLVPRCDARAGGVAEAVAGCADTASTASPTPASPRRAAEMMARPLEDLRIVSCHLGAGASLCAVLGGRSVDTTMGFTPLEGLVMATRAGSVDPGLVIWLLQYGRLSVNDVADELEHGSGLAGLAGGSGDMREVLAGVDRDDPDSCAAADGLGFLGLAVDPIRNATATGDSDITATGRAVRALVVTSRGDLEIAREVRQTLA